MVSTASLHHLRLFYAAYFGAMGLILPFFPVYLSASGMEVGLVGMFIGLLALAKVIAPPWTGYILDRYAAPGAHHIRRFVLYASLAASLLAMSLAFAPSIWPLLCVTFGFGLLWAAVLPLADGISVTVSEAAIVEYGHLRLWGSVGFVAVSLAAGKWLVDTRIDAFPYWLAGLLLLMALSARGFPDDVEYNDHPDQGRGRYPAAFFFLLAASFLMQASHGAYYGLYSLYLMRLGYSGMEIGALWVLGVLAEIILMWRGSRAVQNADPAWVLGGCLLLAALRWLGIGLLSQWYWLAPLQLLHAASFAAFHVAAITAVRRLAPAERHAAAQGWYSAAGFGLGAMAGITGCGIIAQHAGFPQAFLVCTGIALLGVPFAMKLAGTRRRGSEPRIDANERG